MSDQLGLQFPPPPRPRRPVVITVTENRPSDEEIARLGITRWTWTARSNRGGSYTGLTRADALAGLKRLAQIRNYQNRTR